ncbi:MAG: hypothetical protein ACSLFP_02860, partial [Acidimicrobiales bacterium]
MSARASRWGRSGVGLLLALSMVAAACSSSGDDDAGPGPDGGSEGSVEVVDGVLQQLWVLDRLVAVDLDGDVIDLSDALLELAGEGLGEPIDLSSIATFAPAPSL